MVVLWSKTVLLNMDTKIGFPVKWNLKKCMAMKAECHNSIIYSYHAICIHLCKHQNYTYKCVKRPCWAKVIGWATFIGSIKWHDSWNTSYLYDWTIRSNGFQTFALLQLSILKQGQYWSSVLTVGLAQLNKTNANVSSKIIYCTYLEKREIEGNK